MKKLVLLMSFAFLAMTIQAKTLIVYYSFTNNVATIAADMQAQTGADMLRIEPAEEGVDYAANGYAIGSALISAIRNNPDDAASYPAIKPVSVDLSAYDVVMVATPLWWSNMAAPMQTFLFHYGPQMAGKKIGLIVSSASSGISSVEADAHRLIPAGDFLTPSLWIRSAQTSNSHTLNANWLDQINYAGLASGLKSVSSHPSVMVSVATDVIHVSGSFTSLSLFTADGKKVLESAQSSISTASLMPGMYLAQVEANNQTTTQKILVKK